MCGRSAGQAMAAFSMIADTLVDVARLLVIRPRCVESARLESARFPMVPNLRLPVCNFRKAPFVCFSICVPR